jgi:hypothetical protein
MLACPTVLYFFTITHFNDKILNKKKLLVIKCVLIFPKTFA